MVILENMLSEDYPRFPYLAVYKYDMYHEGERPESLLFPHYPHPTSWTAAQKNGQPSDGEQVGDPITQHSIPA